MQVSITYTTAFSQTFKSKRLLRSLLAASSAPGAPRFKVFSSGSGANMVRFLVAPDFAQMFESELRGCLLRMSRGAPTCPLCGRAAGLDLVRHAARCGIAAPPPAPVAPVGPAAPAAPAAQAQAQARDMEREYARVCAALRTANEEAAKSNRSAEVLVRALRRVEACARGGDTEALVGVIGEAWREYDDTTQVVEIL